MNLNHNETYTLAMRYKQILFGLILFAILGVFLQITSKFHFFYIEQLQLFQFSGDYLADKISNPGGFSLIIGEFLTQFFITPYAGPFIIAAILTSIGLTMRAIIRQINPDKELFLLYLLPVLSLLLIQYDFNYLVQGTIAFLFCLISLNAWMRIKDPRYRLSAALVITPATFLDRRTDCRAILIKCGSQGSDKPFQTGVLFFSGFN